MIPRHRNLTVAALFVALSACSTDTEPTSVETVEVEAPLEDRTGSVLAEFRGDDSTTVHAQFLHLRGISAEAALDALNVWTPDRELSEDACSLRSFAIDPATDIEIEMLDVGPITLEYFDESIRLEGRRLPDLIGGVSGVVYGSEQGWDIAAADIAYLPESTYRLTAPGSTEAGGFDVSVTAPVVPEIALVGGQPFDEIARIDANNDISIEWTVPITEDESRLYLDLRSASDTRLRCRLEDDGFFSLPSGIVDELRDDSSRLDLTLRRVEVADVEIDGLENGEIVFAASDNAILDTSR